jgi:hypothetical protein
MKTVIALVMAVALALVTAGCGEADTSPQEPADGDSLGQLAPPGLYELEGGRTQALGVLAQRDLEGGFWAVVSAYPGETADEAEVVAVIANAEQLDVDLGALEGSFVKAEGQLLDGASIRMAGPELEADKLERVDDVAVPGAEGSGD